MAPIYVDGTRRVDGLHRWDGSSIDAIQRAWRWNGSALEQVFSTERIPLPSGNAFLVSVPARLYSVEPSTGVFTAVGPTQTNVPIGGGGGIGGFSLNGRAYVVASVGSGRVRLYECDTRNGTFRAIGVSVQVNQLAQGGLGCFVHNGVPIAGTATEIGDASNSGTFFWSINVNTGVFTRNTGWGSNSTTKAAGFDFFTHGGRVYRIRVPTSTSIRLQEDARRARDGLMFFRDVGVGQSVGRVQGVGAFTIGDKSYVMVYVRNSGIGLYEVNRATGVFTLVGSRQTGIQSNTADIAGFSI